jgi:hypothetical protein
MKVDLWKMIKDFEEEYEAVFTSYQKYKQERSDVREFFVKKFMIIGKRKAAIENILTHEDLDSTLKCIRKIVDYYENKIKDIEDK